ncbi:DUF6261 family protein [Parabacteroides chinchillae]
MKNISAIRSVSLTRPRLGTLCNFYQNIVSLLLPDAVQKWPQLANDAAELQTLTGLLTRQLGRRRKMNATVQTLKADEQRDRTSGFILQVVTAYRFSPLEAEAEAARQLYVITRAYRRLRIKSRDEQTALIDSLCRALDKPELADAIQTLHLAPAIELFRQQNERYKQESRYAIDETLEHLDYVGKINSRDLRPKAAVVYQNITRTINALTVMHPSDKLSILVQSFNGQVDSLQNDLAHEQAAQTRNTESKAEPATNNPASAESRTSVSQSTNQSDDNNTSVLCSTK